MKSRAAPPKAKPARDRDGAATPPQSPRSHALEAETAGQAARLREIEAAWREAENLWREVETVWREAPQRPPPPPPPRVTTRTVAAAEANPAQPRAPLTRAQASVTENKPTTRRIPGQKARHARVRRRWPRRLTTALALVLTAAVALVTVAERPQESPGGRPAPLDAATINPAGSYSFLAPPGWGVAFDGPVTTLESAAGDAVVAIGTAPAENVYILTDEVIAGLGETYDHLRVRSRDDVQIGTQPGVLVRGRAVNENGVPLRFQAAVLAGETGNFVLSAFFAAKGPTSAVRDETEQVFASFRENL